MRLTLYLAVIMIGCYPCATSAALAENAPDILLIVADDLGPHLNVYGDNTVPTPRLDALAEQGTRFDNAYVTQSSCSSSRSSMFTGLHAYQNHQLGISNMGYTMHTGVPNFVSILKENGYRTGVLGKIHVHPESDFPFDLKNLKMSKDVAYYTSAADQFIQDSEGKRFFLMVNYTDPHRPFAHQAFGLPEQPAGPAEVQVFPEHGEINDQSVLDEVAGYYNAVQRVDIGVGRILDVLERNGRADSTLVVFVGDHGPAFSRGKTTTYEFGVKVPLLVRWPAGTQAGLVSEALVSTLDFFPTFLDAAGVALPDYIPGRSFLPLLNGDESNQRRILVTEWNTHGPGYQPQRTIRNGRYKLILNLRPEVVKQGLYIDGCVVAQVLPQAKYDGTEVRRVFDLLKDPPEVELYDLLEDPIEYHNLAEDTEHSEVRQELEEQLQAYRESTGDPTLDTAYFNTMVAYHDHYLDTIQSGGIWQNPIDMSSFQLDFENVRDGFQPPPVSIGIVDKRCSLPGNPGIVNWSAGKAFRLDGRRYPEEIFNGPQIKIFKPSFRGNQ